MSYFDLEIPPGVVRSGTEYQSKGRWFDTNLIRWYEGNVLGPILGWAARSSSAVTGAARAIITWRDDSDLRWASIGTHSNLYAMGAGGTLTDITPSGFTTGRADATDAVGFGYGKFGAGAFGTPRASSGSSQPATVWDLDTFGQFLNACASDDGALYEWQLDTGSPAVAITGAPTNCLGLVVTPQRFVFALGAGGNRRKVQWCDQEDNTSWTPGPTNQAGDLDIKSGTLVCGRSIGDQILVLTDIGAHIFDYLGLPYVYSGREVGSGCGAISKRCIVAAGNLAVWWSQSGFWVYDGGVRPIQCPVWDYLLRTVTSSQVSKISAWHNSENQEVWWLWPAGNENDSYVKWNYKFNIWDIGMMDRLCGTVRGIFTNPLLVGSNGYVNDHEFGYLYDGDQPYARSGPVEIGKGDRVMEVMGIIPDEKTAGQVSATFRSRDFPNAPETVSSATTFDGTGFSDLRFSARQVELMVTGVAASNWRWGIPRLDVEKGGER